MWGILYKIILLVPHNIVMDMNNAMLRTNLRKEGSAFDLDRFTKLLYGNAFELTTQGASSLR